ncbi:DUF2147 domain-containing protein [Frigidibacter sp. SLM-1]|nr:DUF2147 domain-containing protein [Frigidibacter sp. ROC022]MCR8725361.1 DUF2147 domain-containing protein [Frigidibacter sp. ROC022]
MTRILVAVLGLALAPLAALADPVEGLWKTEVDDGAYAHVRFGPCGDRLCGVIANTFNSAGEYKSENLGRKIVWDMRADGGGSYSGGQIWQPSTGKVYRSKMQLSGDTLKVSGCIGPICKKQNWTRVK